MNITKESLSGATVAELEALAVAVAEALETARQKARGEALDKIKAIAAEAGMTMQEVQELAAGRVKRLKGGRSGSMAFAVSKPAKYVNPKTAAEWSGMGRKPRWVSEHLENGGNLDDLKNPAWED